MISSFQGIFLLKPFLSRFILTHETVKAGTFIQDPDKGHLWIRVLPLITTEIRLVWCENVHKTFVMDI